MAKERIVISFSQTKIHKTTSEYLCSKLDQTEDEELIRNISYLSSGQKKKLKAEEANYLLKRLLQAILINDNLDESSVASENEDLNEMTSNSVNETENDEEDSEEENKK